MEATDHGTIRPAKDVLDNLTPEAHARLRALIDEMSGDSRVENGVWVDSINIFAADALRTMTAKIMTMLNLHGVELDEQQRRALSQVQGIMMAVSVDALYGFMRALMRNAGINTGEANAPVDNAVDAIHALLVDEGSWRTLVEEVRP